MVAARLLTPSTDVDAVKAALGEGAFAAMTAANCRIYYERRAGSHGQHIGRHKESGRERDDRGAATG